MVTEEILPLSSYLTRIYLPTVISDNEAAVLEPFTEILHPSGIVIVFVVTAALESELFELEELEEPDELEALEEEEEAVESNGRPCFGRLGEITFSVIWLPLTAVTLPDMGRYFDSFSAICPIMAIEEMFPAVS